MSEADLPRDVVEEELQIVLGWPGLARSPQLAKFLNYVVKARLAGDAGNIKAYSIAVDVFGRPSTFDPQSDPIVRVQARRLRALLEEYYAGEGATRPLRFYLPVGRYVPDFVTPGRAESIPDAVAELAPGVDPPPEDPSSIPVTAPTSNAWFGEGVLFLAALGAVILLVIALGNLLGPRIASANLPIPPRIAIAEFTSVTDTGGGTSTDVAGLAVEMVTDLGLFKDIVASYQDPVASTPAGPTAVVAADDRYVLTGITRRNAVSEQVTATLRQVGSDDVLWTMTVTRNANEATIDVDDVSRRFAEQLGSHRGPLHAKAVAWLQTHDVPAGGESEYLCGLLFSRYRDSGLAADNARALDCVTRLLWREPTLASALAMRASLTAETALASSPPGLPDATVLAAARADLVAALQADPTDSLIWEQNGRLLEMSGIVDDAEAAYSSALQLNPANLDAVAAYGRLLTLRSASARGEGLAQRAISAAISPPPWYYTASTVAAFRSRNFTMAIAGAQQLIKGDVELGSVIAVISARRTGADAVLNRYLAQVLDVARFRRFGILPVLRSRIGDSALMDAIASELAAAGVGATALNGTF